MNINTEILIISIVMWAICFMVIILMIGAHTATQDKDHRKQTKKLLRYDAQRQRIITSWNNHLEDDGSAQLLAPVLVSEETGESIECILSVIDSLTEMRD